MIRRGRSLLLWLTWFGPAGRLIHDGLVVGYYLPCLYLAWPYRTHIYHWMCPYLKPQEDKYQLLAKRFNLPLIFFYNRGLHSISSGYVTFLYWIYHIVIGYVHTIYHLDATLAYLIYQSSPYSYQLRLTDTSSPGSAVVSTPMPPFIPEFSPSG